MDIFSHGLWAGALAGARTDKTEFISKKTYANAFFWGIFPDLFAFTVPFVWTLFHIVTAGGAFPSPDLVEPPAGEGAMYSLAYGLYNISHSFVIFGLLFGLLWLVRKKAPLILLGWPLHILMDIPTHTDTFFPTPILWPISSVHFVHGFSWAVGWFMIANYSLLAGLYLFLFKSETGAHERVD